MSKSHLSVLNWQALAIGGVWEAKYLVYLQCRSERYIYLNYTLQVSWPQSESVSSLNSDEGNCIWKHLSQSFECDNLEPSIQGCAILCECASITDAFAAVADCLFGCWIANLSSDFTTLITMDWNIMLYKRGKSKSFLLQKYPAYQRKTWKKFAATELTVCAKIVLKPTALLIHFFNINKIDLRKRVYLAIASY